MDFLFVLGALLLCGIIVAVMWIAIIKPMRQRVSAMHDACDNPDGTAEELMYLDIITVMCLLKGNETGRRATRKQQEQAARDLSEVWPFAIGTPTPHVGRLFKRLGVRLTEAEERGRTEEEPAEFI